MNEIIVIVEGQTEQAFVQDLLQPHFLQWQTHIRPTLPGRAYKRGGVRPWQSIQGDIIRLLKERRDRICTTMFDYYAMPLDWPDRSEAPRHPWHERGQIVEQALHENIAQALGHGFNPYRFIPYVQLHEFEALLFTDVSALATAITTFAPDKAFQIAQQYLAILKSFDSPEAINDGRETAPSKRIHKLAPGYNKTLHGPIVAASIGLEKLRQTCTHFGQWIDRLETAAQGKDWTK